MVAEREDIFIAAEKAVRKAASATTPTVKGTKKRRKVKQHPTPSPAQKCCHVSSELVPTRDSQQEEEEGHQAGTASDQLDDDKVLTAEEIARLYEDYDPEEK